MLRISANLGFLWKELPLTDAVRRAKAAGFDAVEFHWPYDTPAEELKGAVDETRLPVVGINTRMGNPGEVGLACLPGREAEARATIGEAIAYAKTLGAAYISVMGGRPDPAKRTEARRTYLKVIDEAARAAEAAGLMAVIEPLNPYDVPGAFLNSSALAAEIIGELGRPNLKLLFDCYHVQIVEGDLTRRLEKLMPIIGHIQIAAVPSRAEPDEGEVAYDRLLPVIEKLGYRGFVAAEYRPRGEVEAGLGWLQAYRDAPGARLAE